MERLTSRKPLTEKGAMNLSLTDLYMRLKSYEDLEEEGRLLALPCKVGTPVYRLEYNQHDGYWIELGEFDFRDVNVFGETVFFTREEAEEKQKQKNEKWTRLM